RSRMQRNISEGRQTLGITETDIFVTDVADNARTVARVDDRSAGVSDPGYRIPAGFDRLVQDFENALARGATRLHKLIELMQTADRVVEKGRQHEKGDQIAQLHRAAEHGAAAKSEDNDRTDRLK